MTVLAARPFVTWQEARGYTRIPTVLKRAEYGDGHVAIEMGLSQFGSWQCDIVCDELTLEVVAEWVLCVARRRDSFGGSTYCWSKSVIEQTFDGLCDDIEAYYVAMMERL